jgi:hypothetical protein
VVPRYGDKRNYLQKWRKLYDSNRASDDRKYRKKKKNMNFCIAASPTLPQICFGQKGKRRVYQGDRP